MWSRCLGRRTAPDSGAAVVTVLLVTLVLTVAGAAFLATAWRELENAGRDRASGRYTAAADGGVDRTMEDLDRLGLATLRTCTSYVPPDGQADYSRNPCTFEYEYTGTPGGERYTAVVTPTAGKAQLDPPTESTGYYTIVSQTRDRNGEFVRQIEQTVRISVISFPIGIFAHEVNAGGAPKMYDTSIFTDGDVFWRSKITFSGIDAYYGGGAGAHALGVIYNRAADPIHSSSPVNCDYPYDQDSLGGTVPPGSCPSANPPPPATSLFPDEDLGVVLETNTLDEDDYADLKALAMSTGTYWSYSGSATPTIQESDVPANVPDEAVFYVEFTTGTPASNKVSWKADFGPCGTRNGVIVVRNGSLTYNSNNDWTGVILLPDSGAVLSGNGTGHFNGSVFTDEMGNTGTVRFAMPACWLDNMPSVLTSVTPLHWRQVDR